MTSVAYGIAMPSGRGVLTAPTYCGEAVAFFQRLVTQPSVARKNLYNAVVSSLVAAGVWPKLDVLYIFAAADLATALTNLARPNYGATAINSPTFTTDIGITGASTKYIATGFNPTTAASPNFTPNSASLFAWGDQASGNAGALAGYASSFLTQLYARWTDGKFYGAVNRSGQLAATNASGAGLATIVRSSSNAETGYFNSTTVGSDAVAAATQPSDTIAFLSNGGNCYTGTVYCGGFGSALSSPDVIALYNALHVYLHAVAGIA
jgi:hypothetical protein